jgi:hypothetical protein
LTEKTEAEAARKKALRAPIHQPPIMQGGALETLLDAMTSAAQTMTEPAPPESLTAVLRRQFAELPIDTETPIDPRAPTTPPRDIDPNSYEGQRLAEEAEFEKQRKTWQEKARVLRPERCLWAWRYAAFPDLMGSTRQYYEAKDGRVPVPRDLQLAIGIGGWTFCGRHTIRVINLDEATRCEAVGIEWHLYENEPADALRATAPLERPKTEEEWPEFFSKATLSLHSRPAEVTCDWCKVSLDAAAEADHLLIEERLGEAVMTLRPVAGVIAYPRAEWWKDRLYRPEAAAFKPVR